MEVKSETDQFLGLKKYASLGIEPRTSAEDAVISAVRGGLKQYANNSLLENGRASWPTDPFTALSEKPAGHTEDGTLADEDGEWTFIDNGDGTGQITHQRASFFRRRIFF